MKNILLKVYDSVIERFFYRISDRHISEKLDNKKIAEQISYIKKHAVKLKQYPVSPFFTHRVMSLSGTRPKEDLWANLQLLPFPVAKFALVMMIIIILFLFIPSGNNSYTDSTNPDTITILYNTDSIENEIVSDNQALQFVLLNELSE